MRAEPVDDDDFDLRSEMREASGRSMRSKSGKGRGLSEKEKEQRDLKRKASLEGPFVMQFGKPRTMDLEMHATSGKRGRFVRWSRSSETPVAGWNPVGTTMLEHMMPQLGLNVLHGRPALPA